MPRANDMWVDENAFGLLIGYFEVEDDEYTLEREAFQERFEAFRQSTYDYIALHPPGIGARGIDLGHAVYLELACGDETVDLLGWMKELRARLLDSGFATVGVISQGSRWIFEEGSPETQSQLVGTAELTTWSRPSEPLRRALYGEAATRPDAEGQGGWGPGLYFDTEAVEALGRSPKNAPTALETAGAAFYRVGR